MAAIDKTYVNNYKDYKEIVEWAEKKVYHCPNGTCIHVINDCYNRWEEKDFEDGMERPVLNTCNSVDYFLIKDCPFEVVQDRLKYVYGEEYYNSVKNGTSEFDKFSIDEQIGKNRVKKIRGGRFSNTNYLARINWNDSGKKMKVRFFVDVEVDGRSLWWSDHINRFLHNGELGLWTCSSAYCCHSVKALIRHIRKWKLPKGAIVKARGRYVGEEWDFIVK